jgi:hypothetical protein
MSAASNSTYGGRVDRETSSDYNMYFKMRSGTNRGFVFRDDANNYASINPNGIYSEVPLVLDNSDTPHIQIKNATYGTDLYIGGWTTANSNNISRIRNSSGNLHLDSAANGNLYLNQYSTGEVYARQQLVWHAGNDGSGSGLDADLLDGQNSTLFLRKRSDLGAGQNLNGYTGIGFYHQNSNSSAASGSNYPSGHAGMLTVTADGVMVYQTYHRYDGNAYYHRSYYNGNWYPWRKVWTDGNDGSGSGLDADLLDGYNSDSYLNKNGTSYYQANTWIQFNGGTGYGLYFPSSGAGTHLYPNGSTYSSFEIEGSRGGYWGFSALTGAGRVNAMWKNNVSGFYNETHGWHFHWNSGTLYVGKGTNGGSDATVWESSNDGSGSGLDADLLDGIDSGGFLRSNANDTLSAQITFNGDMAGGGDGHRDHGVYGNYNSYRIHHMWSMGTSYRINASGADFGSLYGFAYTFSNRVYTSNAMAGGHQIVWCQAGTPTSALGTGIWTSGNVTAYSDIAVKTNLERIPDALSKVCRINGYTYDRTDFKPDPETGEMPETRQVGVVAQEVEKVLPEVVSGVEGGKSVAYGNMVGLLIEAIKELKAEVDDLKAQLEEVK